MDLPLASVVVPRAALPEGAESRRVALRNYFCDKDAVAEDAGEHWILTLEWPRDRERYVDPRLEEGLAWWGTDVRGIPHAHRRQGRTTFSLFDTWGLYSWSRWWSGGGKEAAAAADGVTILHVDDHADLMAPRLFQDDGGLVDAITGSRFDIDQPSSVASAISSGAVGMGSFMTPFLCSGVPVQLRHLRQAHPGGRWRLEAGHVADDLLGAGRKRPSINLIADGAPWPRASEVAVSENLGEWLDGLSPNPTLLHIDLDYFSNRFNGDTDWANAPRRLDPSLDVVLAGITGLFRALADHDVSRRIEDVAVAYSPGFFPAEFWPSIDGELRRGLASIGAL
jgi:hypothetical protein